MNKSNKCRKVYKTAISTSTPKSKRVEVTDSKVHSHTMTSITFHSTIGPIIHHNTSTDSNQNPPKSQLPHRMATGITTGKIQKHWKVSYPNDIT